MHKTFAIQALFTFALLGNLGASKLSPDYFNSYSNPLVHTWSLAIEEQFYLLVPVMIIVIRMASRFWECHQQKIILYFLLFLAVVSLMKFVYSDLIYSFVVGETTLENMKDNYYSLSHRFWQLMVGGLVALLGSRVKKNSSSTSELISIGLLLSIAAILFFPLALNTTVATIYVTFASGLLLQLRIKKQISPRWLWRLGRWVGDISYPLYLLHVPIIFLAKFSPILMVGDGVSREIPVIVCVPVIFVFASIVHIRVEKRYRVANDK
jgi:peptidoglycan/LPS O-acetylase OafA/YrhL